ncbi:MAG TPA: hypothetical protein VGK00_08915 [Anaerolineales bacterium]
MDYHHNTADFMAARFFRREYQPKVSQNRQLDPHPDRHCDNSVHPAPAWGCLEFHPGENMSGGVTTPLILLRGNVKFSLPIIFSMVFTIGNGFDERLPPD